jgi:hypothetical protein
MDWIEIISTLGFPIAVSVALAAFVFVIYKQSVKREDQLMTVNAQAIETIGKYANEINVIKEDIKDIKEVILHE